MLIVCVHFFQLACFLCVWMLFPGCTFDTFAYTAASAERAEACLCLLQGGQNTLLLVMEAAQSLSAASPFGWG